MRSSSRSRTVAPTIGFPAVRTVPAMDCARSTVADKRSEVRIVSAVIEMLRVARLQTESMDIAVSPEVLEERLESVGQGLSRAKQDISVALVKNVSPVARDGIEPPTRGFSVRCSTN